MNTEQDAEEDGLSLLELERRRGAQITQNEEVDGDEEEVLFDRDFDGNEVGNGEATGAPGDQRRRGVEPGGAGAQISSQRRQHNTINCRFRR